MRQRYGQNGFGQGVLLARRLIESGVVATEVVLDGWDTHRDNFNTTRDLCRILDPAFSTLLDDLERRDLFERTLVVCIGEFGRTPAIKPGDGRDHWPSNYCAVVAGGGARRGIAIGATDERGETIVDRPIAVADLFATLARLLGIDGSREFTTPNGRPVKLVDPVGVPLPELLG